MKTLTLLSSLLLLSCVQCQIVGPWTGGAFNPWNNPDHPAHRGIARGIAARSFFWPTAPFIRPHPIPSFIPDNSALNSGGVSDERQESLVELSERKNDLDSRIRDAAAGGKSIGAGFRPGFVNNLIRERMQVVNDIRRAQQEAVRDRLALVAKRREIAKQIAESNDPIDFGLLMRSLNRAYGREMAAKSIAHRNNILEKFDRPFLRPVVSVFAPSGLPHGAVAETKIYQNLEEQKGTLLKDEDIFIVTKLSGYTGDKLHLGVDLHGVNETSSDAQALSEDFLEAQLDFQDDMLESQMTLSQNWYDLQLKNAEKQSDLQQKLMEKQLSRAEKIMQLKNKLEERRRDLEEKLAEKRQDLIEKDLERQQKLAEKQKDLLEKQMKKHQKHLEKQAQAEAKALDRQLKIAEKFPGADFVQRQLEFTDQQAQLNDPSSRQERLERGLEFLRSKIRSLPGDEYSRLQKQLEKAAKLERKQRKLEERRLEKQQELLEKIAEKERDHLQKQLEKEHDLREKQEEKEAKKAEKLNDQLEKDTELSHKELERERKLAEKETERLAKQQEKDEERARKEQERERDLVAKQFDKEQKAAEKQRERLQKEEELLKKHVEKEQEKAEEELEKAREKAEKELEKERESAEKQLEREQKSAEKQLEKELKELEKEDDLAQKQLEKDAKQRQNLPIFGEHKEIR